MQTFSVISLLSLAASLVSAAPAPAGGYDLSLPACPVKLQISYSWGGTPQTTWLDDIGGPVIGNLDDSVSNIPIWTLDSQGRLKQYGTNNYLLKNLRTSYSWNGQYNSQNTNQAPQYPGNDGLVIQDGGQIGSNYAAVKCSKYTITGWGNGYSQPPKNVWYWCTVNNDRMYECGYSNYGRTKNPQNFIYLKQGQVPSNLQCKAIFLRATGQTGVANFGQCNPSI